MPAILGWHVPRNTSQLIRTWSSLFIYLRRGSVKVFNLIFFKKNEKKKEGKTRVFTGFALGIL